MLIDGDALQTRLGEDNLVILHAARDSSGYMDTHIPGARLASWRHFAIEIDGVPNELPPLDALTDWIQRVGVNQTSQVVVYDDTNSLQAARLYFTLDYLGMGDRVSLLDGGLSRWIAEGRPVTDASPNAVERGDFVPTPREDIKIEWEEMARLSSEKKNNDNAPFTIVDTRSDQQYRPDEPDGAIPGATQLYWMDCVEDGVLRPNRELKRLFEQANVNRNQPVVVYCNSGVQASYLYFVAKLLGYETRMYDGSMSEWRTKNQAAPESIAN